MKDKARSLLAIMLLSAVAVAAAGCPQAEDMIKQAFKEPKVNVNQVDLTSISLKEIGLNLGLVIDNPNPVALDLAQLDYNFALAGTTLVQGSAGKGLQISAQGKSKAEIPLLVAYEDVKKIYDSLDQQDYVPYKLTGQVSINTPIGKIPVPFTAKGQLPVVRPPEIMKVEVNMKSVSLSGIVSEIKIKLKNPNVFDLDIRKLDYALQLEGRDFSNGSLGAQLVSAKNSGTLKIPVNLDFAGIGAWLQKLISQGSAEYSLSYDAVYNIEKQKVSQKELKEGKVSF